MTWSRPPVPVVFILALALLVRAFRPLAAQERALVPLEVRPSPAFQAALEEGTRSPTGEPGPAYWQQRVDYDIRASVDPAARLLRGEERVTYHNRSPDTLRTVHFRLYQNLFSSGAVNTRAVPVTRGVTLESVVVDGKSLDVAPANAMAADPTGAADTSGPLRVRGTRMSVDLPRPLPSGGEIVFDVGWRFTIPAGEGVPRMGMVDATTGQIAQWYPQVATYDDLTGWDLRPYLSNGEFYLEYGTFDLARTLPAGTLVLATGELVTPEEVLPELIRERLEAAAAADSTVHVGEGVARLAQRGPPGTEVVPRHGAGGVPQVMVPEDDSAHMTKDVVEVFSRNVFPYPYPHANSTEGRVGGWSTR